jgi:site-specific recombinase XerC
VEFLADRAIRKPSPHTAKAYRQDFTATATLLAGDIVAMADLPPQSITKDEIRRAFATYARGHEPASVRRCWSTCSFLYTSELIPANPMPVIGRPKVAKTLPKRSAPRPS